MGRRRTRDLHLPAGVYCSRGWHFWRDPQTGKWHKLGQKWDREARTRWVDLSQGAAKNGTVAELLDSFFAHCEGQVRQGKRSPATHEVNELEAARLKEFFGQMHYLDVTGKHCATYLKKRKDRNKRPTPVRANREIAFLSSAYAWAMGEDRYEVETNPCYGVRRNPESPRERYVETAELRRFTKGHATPRLRCYCLLKRLTALRQGNILKLDDSNLTERGIEYQQNKRGARRIIRWSWALRIVVRATLSLRPALPPMPENVKQLPRPLFPSRYGSQLSSRGFKTDWQRHMRAYCEAGNTRFWEHDIRAKSGSDASSDERARDLLGHTTTATTRKHYRRAPAKVNPLR